ncbi:MAG: hypothetical protein NZ941_03200 [Candidatus Caldarchaeum sp.]|nr:hypothetical protein [Candidatus Caldarchaeum sp.]
MTLEERMARLEERIEHVVKVVDRIDTKLETFQLDYTQFKTEVKTRNHVSYKRLATFVAMFVAVWEAIKRVFGIG